MRLDLFLSLSRLVKRRAAAKELADSGGVRLGGRPIKAAHPVQVGDELDLRIGGRELRVRVAALTERKLRPAEARELYEILSETRVEEDEGGSEGGVMDFLLRRP
ncbi:MAG: RNA-binding S4 domain-containing protein [Candidatus Tectomicrobia bacterium]|uniref:RNA-binding S4 domain-containing protein n=1 Tax=Tectimicrobiota bacterium TaxID=2528274 RepID=A0A932I2Q8_UNCTE|nr:RNA-binding S4 domain-containing protein [Candidatus Tectomicrobia bacterium]